MLIQGILLGGALLLVSIVPFLVYNVLKKIGKNSWKRRRK